MFSKVVCLLLLCATVLADPEPEYEVSVYSETPNLYGNLVTESTAYDAFQTSSLNTAAISAIVLDGAESGHFEAYVYSSSPPYSPNKVLPTYIPNTIPCTQFSISALPTATGGSSGLSGPQSTTSNANGSISPTLVAAFLGVSASFLALAICL